MISDYDWRQRHEIPDDWLCWDGYFGPTEQWYFKKWGVPFKTGGAPATVWLPPAVYALVYHWAHNLRWGGRGGEHSGMLNELGLPMSFEDYVREVLAPASHAP